MSVVFVAVKQTILEENVNECQGDDILKEEKLAQCRM